MFTRSPTSSLPYPTDSDSMMAIPDFNPQSPTVAAARDTYNRIDTGLIQPYNYNANAALPYAEHIGRATQEITTHTNLLSTEAQNSGNFNKANVYRNQAQEARNFDSNLQRRQLYNVDSPLFQQFKQIHSTFGRAIADAEDNFENIIAPAQSLRSQAAPAARADLNEIKRVLVTPQQYQRLPDGYYLQIPPNNYVLKAARDIAAHSSALSQEAQSFGRTEHANTARTHAHAASQLANNLEMKQDIDGNTYSAFQQLVQNFENLIANAEGGHNTQGITNASASPPALSLTIPSSAGYSATTQEYHPYPYLSPVPQTSGQPYHSHSPTLTANWEPTNTPSPIEQPHAFVNMGTMAQALPSDPASTIHYPQPSYINTPQTLQPPAYAISSNAGSSIHTYSSGQEYHPTTPIDASPSQLTGSSADNKPNTPASSHSPVPFLSPALTFTPAPLSHTATYHQPSYAQSQPAYLKNDAQALIETERLLQKAEEIHQDVTDFDSAKKKPDWKNEKFKSALHIASGNMHRLADIAESRGRPDWAAQFRLHASSAETKISTVGSIKGHLFKTDSKNIENIRPHVNQYLDDATKLKALLQQPEEERPDHTSNNQALEVPDISHLTRSRQHIVQEIYSLINQIDSAVTDGLNGRTKDYNFKKMKNYSGKILNLLETLERTITLNQPNLKSVFNEVLKRKNAFVKSSGMIESSKFANIRMTETLLYIIKNLQPAYIETQKEGTNKDIDEATEKAINSLIKDITAPQSQSQLAMKFAPPLIQMAYKVGMGIATGGAM